MKKTILTMAGILMMGIAVNAQTDSTLVSPDEMVQGKETSAPVQNQGPANPERVRVQANDLPQGLKQTLTGSQYKGWESEPVYMNKTTNQYSLSLPNNGSTRVYTFDQTGRPIVGEASGSTVNTTQPTPADNTSTYSSRKSSTNSSSTTGGQKKTTTTHKSSTVRKNGSSDNSSSSTTKGASATPSPAK